MRQLDSELVRDADCYIDEHYSEISSLGKDFFRHFGSERGRISSQVRNLQQIALSATSLADVEDFVKNQMGKDVEHWRDVGDRLLQGLHELRRCSARLDGGSLNQFALRLRLVRGWVRAVVAEYLYRLAKDEMEHTA